MSRHEYTDKQGRTYRTVRLTNQHCIAEKRNMVYKDTRVEGLALYVGREKRWFLRGIVRATQRRFNKAFGAYPEISLEQARDEAMARKRYARWVGMPFGDDYNPELLGALNGQAALVTPELPETSKSMTVLDALNAAWAIKDGERDKELSESTRTSYTSAIDKYAAPWHRLPVHDITKKEADTLYEKIAKGSGIPTANFATTRLSTLFKYMVEADDIPVTKNPFVGLKKYIHEADEAEALETAEDMAEYWAATEDLLPSYKYVQRLAFLTGQRSKPVKVARRDEFDLVAKTWTIPGRNIKGAQWGTGKYKKYVLPLTDMMIEVIREQMAYVDSLGLTDERAEYMNPANSPGLKTPYLANMDGNKHGFINWRKRHGITVTTHGSRHTMVTYLVDREDVVPERIRHKMMNHIVNTTEKRHYDKAKSLQQLRAAYEFYNDAWAAATGWKLPENVTRLRRA